MKKLVLSVFVFLTVMLFTSAALIFNPGAERSECPYKQKVNYGKCPYLNGSGNSGDAGVGVCPFKEKEIIRLIDNKSS